MKEEILRRLLENEESRDDLEWLKSVYNDMHSEPYEQVIRSYTENFTDVIEAGEYDHYGMETYIIDNETYAIHPLDTIEEVLRGYYENLVNDLGYDELGIDLSYYIMMSDTDRRMMANDEADNYVEDLVDEELLELSGLDTEYEEFDEKIEEEESKLEDMREVFEDMDEVDDNYEEFEGMIEDLESEIDDLRTEKEELVDTARYRVRDNHYDDFYECLEDPVECLVNDRGWYSDASDLVEAGFVTVDDDAIVDDMTTNGDYGELNHYDGEYDEIKDSSGDWWVIMRAE
jgi:hypothetical protein